MSFDDEFQTVDLILHSCAETRGVDAFTLALVKSERQIRRLVTHLVFQFPCFTVSDVGGLRASLGRNPRVFLEGFLRGFDVLCPRTVENLIGASYAQLRKRIDEAIDHRNKIFHGQLTSRSLSRKDLVEYVDDIRAWCKLLADGAYLELKYDGFVRNSFRKSEIGDLSERFKLRFSDVSDYEKFIEQHLQRRRFR
jgi:hypothetical protein